MSDGASGPTTSSSLGRAEEGGAATAMASPPDTPTRRSGGSLRASLGGFRSRRFVGFLLALSLISLVSPSACRETTAAAVCLYIRRCRSCLPHTNETYTKLCWRAIISFSSDGGGVVIFVEIDDVSAGVDRVLDQPPVRESSTQGCGESKDIVFGEKGAAARQWLNVEPVAIYRLKCFYTKSM